MRAHKLLMIIDQEVELTVNALYKTAGKQGNFTVYRQKVADFKVKDFYNLEKYEVVHLSIKGNGLHLDVVQDED